MASASPSPAASPSSEAEGDDEFAQCEAEAARQAASEEARKAKQALGDGPSLDLRLGRGSVDLSTSKAAGSTWNAGYDDLGYDDLDEEGESAHDAVEAALKAVAGSRPEEKVVASAHGGLFAKESHLSASSGSLSSSFSAI